MMMCELHRNIWQKTLVFAFYTVTLIINFLSLDDHDDSKDDIDDCIEHIKADTAFILYFSIVFAKREAPVVGRN